MGRRSDEPMGMSIDVTGLTLEGGTRVVRAGLLARGSTDSRAFRISPWHVREPSPHTVAGPRRLPTGFPSPGL
jgi:hypothetical protein